MWFLIWLGMYKAYRNDIRIEQGLKPEEYNDPDDKVLVWPDLVYIEFIALILFQVFLIVWSILVAAPLEEPANPAATPNPSKAPWYFLGLQEMLVYYDPWIAGVLLPTFIIVGLMAIPYLDINKKGDGYYSFKERRVGIFIFMYGWVVLWLFLIIIGTFFRGPNWNFFGPFEYWDLIGFDNGISLINDSGEELPKWINEMKSLGANCFYKYEKGERKYYDLFSHTYKKIPGSDAFIILDSYRENPPVIKNTECSVHDIDDGVLCLEFQSKSNAIGDGIGLSLIHI